MAERAAKSLMIQFKSSVGLGSSNSAGDGHTDHRVVAGTDQTHHLDVSRDGGGASELGITVHTAHGVGQAVGAGPAATLSGCRVRPVPPPEATEKYFLPFSIAHFL